MKYAEIKKDLIKKQQDLEERLGRIHRHIHHVDEKIDPDFAEQATQRENDEVVYKLSTTVKRQLSEVRRALGRLENGTYDVCASCGGRISIARLTAIPYTSLCRECASEKG
jgi:DnaK suppressor protein